MRGSSSRIRLAITSALSLFLVGLVVLVAGGRVTAEWLPQPSTAFVSAIPHINVLISLAAMSTILFGWAAIRRGDVRQHRLAMSFATLLFACFLSLYLYRLAIRGGPTPFTGPRELYRAVYLPVLLGHIAIAIVCIPLVVHVLSLGLTVSIEQLERTNHARIGRPAATLWLLSFGLGIVVYVLLYWT